MPVDSGGFSNWCFQVSLWLAYFQRVSIWLVDKAIQSASIWKPFSDNNDTEGWTETKTIYVGYDDLFTDTAFGTIFRAMGKTYEISCTIDKTGNVGDGVKTEGERDDDKAEGKTSTTFEMETTFAGVSILIWIFM